MTFIQVPLKGVPTELRAEIEAALPTPLKVPGWKFKGRVWRKLTQINTKDKLVKVSFQFEYAVNERFGRM